MATEERFGTNGYPLCTACGADRATSNGHFPGLCAECIAKIPADERAKTVAAATEPAADDADGAPF